MRSLLFALPFIALTFFCWGIYGPVLHEGQHEMGVGSRPSSLGPFMCVGIAYFVIAVVVPMLWLKLRGEAGKWTLTGAIWSFAAGAAGALGALGIILAFKFRGDPIYVMPLVFGSAPVVNTFVTMFMGKTFREANVIFFAGVIVVASGAAGVMWFKPVAKNFKVEGGKNDGPITVTVTEVVHEPRVTAGSGAAGETTASAAVTKTTVWKAANLKELETDKKLAPALALYRKSLPLTFEQFGMIVASIALTALSWGSYGPVLHKGQMKMAGSRLRPFLCVGLAYFLIAVLVPLPLQKIFSEQVHWNFSGVAWSLAGGAAGAIGALGIILAFNFGGKPIFVMPLVFGGAPVVNTLVTTWHEGTIGSIEPPFFAALMLVIGGAMTVLIFAPKPKGGHGHKPASDSNKPVAKAKPDRQPPAQTSQNSEKRPYETYVPTDPILDTFDEKKSEDRE